MHLVSTYIIFAHCLVGVHSSIIHYVGVHAHDLAARLILPNSTTTFK